MCCRDEIGGGQELKQEYSQDAFSRAHPWLVAVDMVRRG